MFESLKRPEPHHLKWSRFGMVSGIMFFVLILAASITAPELPDSSLPVDQYAATYARDHSGHITSTFLSALAGIAFLVFLAGLFATIRPLADGDVALPAIMGLSGAAAITMILTAQAIYAAAAIAATTAGVEPGFVRGLDTVVPTITLYSGIPRATFLLAASLVLVRDHLAPRWLGAFGGVAALVGVIGAGATFDLDGPLVAVGFLSMVLFALWILVTSTSVLIRQRATRADESRSLSPAR